MCDPAGTGLNFMSVKRSSSLFLRSLAERAYLASVHLLGVAMQAERNFFQTLSVYPCTSRDLH
jgi:hypothetical protein